MSGQLTIGGKNFTSRLMMETCKYRSNDDLTLLSPLGCPAR